MSALQKPWQLYLSYRERRRYLLSTLRVRNQDLKVYEVNLHKSRIASAELLLSLEKDGHDVALVQES